MQITMAPATSRVRTSFDPEHELPRLHQWFSENPHPSRLTIQMYVKELNSLPSRQSRKLLEVHNLCYWFKNARAAYKRAELRMKRDSGNQAHLVHHHQRHLPQLQNQTHYQQHHPMASHHHHPQAPTSTGPLANLSNSCNSHSPSPNSSSPSFVIDPHELAAKLTVLPQARPLQPANLAATVADLKSLIATSSPPIVPPLARMAQPLQPPPPPPITTTTTTTILPMPITAAAATTTTTISELGPDQSLYLLLFFMKFFDLDSCWRRNVISN